MSHSDLKPKCIFLQKKGFCLICYSLNRKDSAKSLTYFRLSSFCISFVTNLSVAATEVDIIYFSKIIYKKLFQFIFSINIQIWPAYFDCVGFRNGPGTQFSNILPQSMQRIDNIMFEVLRSHGFIYFILLYRLESLPIDSRIYFKQQDL